MDMYGVKFGNKHSYEDWGVYLYSSSKSYPDPKEYKVSVPYSNKVLKLSNAFTPFTYYENRTIKITFKVYDNELSWSELYTTIANHVHGQDLHVVFDTDPDWYWDATCTLETPSSDEDVGEFSISCDCFPYKLKNSNTVVTTNVTKVNTEVRLVNSRMEVRPTIRITKPVHIKYTNVDGEEKTLILTETNKDITIDDFYLFKGNNNIVLSLYNNTPSTVTITYRKGEL